MCPKLLIFNYEYPPIGGGGGVACENIAKALVKHHGYQITVITAGVGDQISKTTTPEGIELIHIPCAKKRKHRSSAPFLFMFRYNLNTACYVWKHRKELRQFDVIHTHFAIPTGPAGWFAGKILKKPNVLTLHGGELFKQPLELSGYDSRFINAVVRFLIKASDRVTANSNDTKNAAHRFLSITTPIDVITLGYAPPCCDVPSKNPKPDHPVSLIMVSRLIKRKSLDTLIEALANIDHKKWTLTLVGDGPEENPLKALCQKQGIAKQVVFTGFVSEAEKMHHLSQSDVFVLPSLHEGLGLVYFEAMFCGLPIITTNNGGQTDFLEPDQNALLVPVQDTVRLAKAIAFAIDHPEWRTQCGKNNRQKIQTLFMASIIEQYDRIFRDAEDQSC